jgi:excinuclease UvrABC ATPase subunit
MRVSEAVRFFAEIPAIADRLRVLERVGMGYVELGQPAPSLSGGEAQRIKLAKEVGRRRRGVVLYVLDEPTTGLSPYDTERLLELLDELVAGGHSVIVVEHDPMVLSSCDWICELGPGGGVEGGRVVAEGPPATLRGDPRSVTGRYLLPERGESRAGEAGT